MQWAGVTPTSSWTATCLATWWEWDFGDGTTSNVQAPQHTFATGTYDITLRVVACGDTLSLTRPAYITSTTVAPVAGMAFTDTVCTGQPVTFTNSSLGATGYSWDFGDGSGSTLSDPVHSYAAAGTYIVELAASNSCMGDTIASPIIVLGGAAAGFVIGGDTCQLEVQCFNTSAGGPVGPGTLAMDPRALRSSPHTPMPLLAPIPSH
jgi:PKD repeat protein